MKTKVSANYGKQDVRIREFELPEISDNELLVSVISDSVCLSTWKAAKLGSEHKRVPGAGKPSGHYWTRMRRGDC